MDLNELQELQPSMNDCDTPYEKVAYWLFMAIIDIHLGTDPRLPMKFALENAHKIFVEETNATT